MRKAGVGYDTRMRAWATSVGLAAAAAVGGAQSAIDPNTFAGRKDIHNAELNQLWRTLGISAKIRETTVNGSKDTDESFNCGPDGGCDWELFPPEWLLVDDGGDEMVVRITPTDGYGDFSRFLVFHGGQAGWRLVDYLDSTLSRYSRAQVSVIYSGGKRWMVLRSSPRCGTGCGLDPAEWFELKNGKLRRVLGVPLLGHDGKRGAWTIL